MANDRCPWCGAGPDDNPNYASPVFSCETIQDYTNVRGDKCHERAEIQLRDRIATLESILQTIADTHGPGTLAGDAARNALEEAKS